MFKKKFWLSFFLTIPVLAFSHTIQELLNFSVPMFPGSDWIAPILGTFIFFYGGLVFLKGAKAEIADRLPGMMTLISLAITVAFIYSLAVTLGLEGMDFWWELTTLITIMLLGHWLEMASVMGAQGALKELAKLLPDEAELIEKNTTRKVSVSSLVVDNLVLVRPGGTIPTDGQIKKGTSEVDESMLTGESKPVRKEPGGLVVGGSINGSGALTVAVTKTGDDTALAGIMKLVAEAQNSKSKTQIVADRAAFYLTFIALGAAVLTALGWLLFSDRSVAFILERVVTVLVVACPHALGLAVPLVTAISTTLAAKNGLLVRERMSLETARNLDIVLFDKTGTLTQGKHGVTNIWADKNHTKKEILHLTASLEQQSEHIVGRGIVTKANQEKVKLDQVEAFRAIPGYGVQGTLHGSDTYKAVSFRYIAEQQLTIPEDFAKAAKQAAIDGKTEVYLVAGKKVIGAIALADVIRDEAKMTIDKLRAMGIKSAMITGDSEEVARYVGRQLGIEQYFADVKPEDKAAKVKQLQKNGAQVAMVGDGVNDAPALTQADVGIAIGAGTDVAIESAGIVLASNDPLGVAKITMLSKATYRKMVQNLGWATGYNALAIPLAAGVTAGFGFVLSPAIGAVLMSLSTIIVAFNAQLLRRLNLSARGSNAR
jgi:Cu2+-exporting ATPase